MLQHYCIDPAMTESHPGFVKSWWYLLPPGYRAFISPKPTLMALNSLFSRTDFIPECHFCVPCKAKSLLAELFTRNNG